MTGKRKQYTPEFKFKVVLECLQRDTTMEEVCRKFGVSSSMISRWRRAFQQKGPEIFSDQRDPMSRRKALGYDPGESPDDLKKLIGELTVQYVQCKRPKADKELAVRIEAAHEKDDTMDHRTLAALLRTGKNRIKRVMHTYGSQPKASARSMSTEASQPRLCPISCVKKRLSGSATKGSSPLFWRSS
jgi:transposase